MQTTSVSKTLQQCRSLPQPWGIIYFCPLSKKRLHDKKVPSAESISFIYISILFGTFLITHSKCQNLYVQHESGFTFNYPLPKRLSTSAPVLPTFQSLEGLNGPASPNYPIQFKILQTKSREKRQGRREVRQANNRWVNNPYFSTPQPSLPFHFISQYILKALCIHVNVEFQEKGKISCEVIL